MEQKKRKLRIDFLYLDLSSCARCKGTDASLDEAISEVSRVLDIIGVKVVVRRKHVKSEGQARRLGFMSSPTIHINGKDIQGTLKESLCESCTDLIGGERCDCRVWTYHGKEFASPPPALIVDAILKEVYGSSKPECCPQRPFDVPENIKRFLAARK